MVVSAAKIPNVQPNPTKAAPVYIREHIKSSLGRTVSGHIVSFHPRAVPSATRPEGISIFTHMSETLTLKFVVLPLMVVQVQPTEEVQVLHDVRST
jgi:hypothetical protein